MAVAEPGSTCHSFLPFRDVDGGEGRACRGVRPDDVQSSYYLQHSATSLQDCQDLCVRQSETDVTSCKGISYDSVSGTCLVWTLAIGATAPESPTSLCQRYEPFVEMGRDRACRGSHSQDISDSYYTSQNSSEAPNLEACRVRCQQSSSCRGRRSSETE